MFEEQVCLSLSQSFSSNLHAPLTYLICKAVDVTANARQQTYRDLSHDLEMTLRHSVNGSYAKDNRQLYQLLQKATGGASRAGTLYIHQVLYYPRRAEGFPCAEGSCQGTIWTDFAHQSCFLLVARDNLLREVSLLHSSESYSAVPSALEHAPTF